MKLARIHAKPEPMPQRRAPTRAWLNHWLFIIARTHIRSWTFIITSVWFVFLFAEWVRSVCSVGVIGWLASGSSLEIGCMSSLFIYSSKILRHGNRFGWLALRHVADYKALSFQCQPMLRQDIYRAPTTSMSMRERERENIDFHQASRMTNIKKLFSTSVRLD